MTKQEFETILQKISDLKSQINNIDYPTLKKYCDERMDCWIDQKDYPTNKQECLWYIDVWTNPPSNEQPIFKVGNEPYRFDPKRDKTIADRIINGQSKSDIAFREEIKRLSKK